MPPIDLNNIKDALPVDKVDPSAAVNQLSKSDGGALFTMGVWLIVIAALMMFGTILYFSNKRDAQKDKDDAKYQSVISYWYDKYNTADSFNRVYLDSIHTLNFINQVNMTKGEKTIILTPKREAK